MFDGREVGWNARNASSGGEPLSAPPYATECAMTLVAIGGSQFANVKIEMADVVVE